MASEGRNKIPGRASVAAVKLGCGKEKISQVSRHRRRGISFHRSSMSLMGWVFVTVSWEAMVSSDFHEGGVCEGEPTMRPKR